MKNLTHISELSVAKSGSSDQQKKSNLAMFLGILLNRFTICFILIILSIINGLLLSRF